MFYRNICHSMWQSIIINTPQAPLTCVDDNLPSCYTVNACSLCKPKALHCYAPISRVGGDDACLMSDACMSPTLGLSR